MLKKKQSSILILILLFCFCLNAQVSRKAQKKSNFYKENYCRVSTGVFGNHTLEIKNGTLWAWGSNIYGQCGDGTTNAIVTPTQMGTDNDWVSVSAGTSFSVGLKANGTIWAWGINNNGQMGNGVTGSNILVPTQVGSVNTWISISAGGDHVLALKSDGTLWAWGLNSSGQLGDGTATARYSPTQIGSDDKWVTISAGNAHSTAIKSDGTLWAWGYNFYGLLGDGTNTNKNTPTQIAVGTYWLLVSAGGNHTMALKNDGTLWTMGYNNKGQLGDGTTTNRNIPTQVGALNTWSTIEAGGNNSYAIKADGTAWAWGSGTNGQLGDGATLDRNTPTQIGVDNKWVGISAGGTFTMGFKSEGTLWAWGSNTGGRLGNGNITDQPTPVQITTDDKWLMITAGEWNNVGIKTDGTIWTWGDNTYGQLGDGTLIQKNKPIKIGSNNTWAGVASGRGFNLALRTDGTLWAWGNNGFGQLGDGTTINKTSPIQIGTDNNWVSVFAGYAHSFAIKSDGTLWAWGWNNNGQLGDGTTVNKSSPVQIGSNKWTSISAGVGHTMGIRYDGTLWAWGMNSTGQLGDGTTVAKTSPVQVGSGVRWTNITAGYYHSFGIRSDGTLWAWGNNAASQLGDGTSVDKTSPTQLGSDNKWIFGSASRYDCHFIKSDGTLWAWGSNPYGQAGNGSVSALNTPTQIGTNTNWVYFSQGKEHGVGLKADRTNFCAAGYNLYGQLGDNTTTDKSSFVCNTNCNPPSAPIATNVSTCFNTTATLSATGTGTLSWYNAATGGTYLGSGANFITPVLTSATTYYVQDSTCAESARTAVNVSINSLPNVTANATSTNVCAGTSTTLTGGGAISYTWTGGIINGISFIPSTTTTYTVTGTDANGCSNSATQTITVNSLPNVTANATSTNVCAGTSITLTGGGAVSYTWIPGVSNGVPFVISSTSNYMVTGTDANGCSNSNIISINVNSLPNVTATATANTLCAGGSTTLNASGAVSYIWTGGVNSGVSFSPSSTTTYTVTGTDANGCSNTATQTIAVNNLPTITATANPDTVCTGGSTTLTASGASTYVWSNGVANGVSFIPNASNTYTVTATDNNGCVATATVTVVVNSLPVINNISTVNTVCNGTTGSATANVSGGLAPYTYTWSNGDNTPMADNLSAGQYQVQVLDANGCLAFTNTSISANDGPSITLLGSTNPTCFGLNNGSISISVTGGTTPYSALWSNGDTLLTINNLVAGPYDVTVKDLNNCSASFTISLSQPTQMINSFSTTPSQCASTTGSASANVSGGTGAYNYSWGANAANQTTQTATNLGAGIYAVTITDANGCSISEVATVNNSATLLTATIGSVTAGDCSVMPSGSAVMSASMGVGAYTYLWSNGNTNDSISGLQPGTYYCTVTDANLCSFTQSVVIPSSIDGLQQNLCMVTVDTTTLTNKVIWEKTITNDIKEFKIYRESSIQNVYTAIATVPFTSISEYTDPVANPAVHAWRYKITAVDSCGKETPYSAAHKTIHLSQNLGLGGEINLAWDQYEGFPYYTYYIWRHDPSTNWVLLDSLSASFTTYIDFTPPSVDSRYMIEIIPPTPCNSSFRINGIDELQTAVVRSRSNIKTQRLIGISENKQEINFSVYPNPAHDFINVNVEGFIGEEITISLQNILGQDLLTFTSKQAFNKVSTFGLGSGTYLIKVKTKSGIKLQKVILN